MARPSQELKHPANPGRFTPVIWIEVIRILDQVAVRALTQSLRAQGAGGGRHKSSGAAETDFLAQHELFPASTCLATDLT